MDLHTPPKAPFIAAAPAILGFVASSLFTQHALAVAIDATSYDTLAAALADYENGDVIDIEPDDTGVIAVSAAAISGKAINFDATTTATLLIDLHYEALSSTQQSLPLYNISGITVAGEADPEAVWDHIAVTGTLADKFKLFWSNQDAQYYVDWPIQSVTINEVGVQIGNLYAAHLEDGGDALLDTVQTKASGTPNFAARRQSLHDNILGNLGDAVIASRFPSLPDPRSAAAKLFGSRPFHDGVVSGGLYTKPAAKTALAWDLAAGIDYFDELPAMFGNTIAMGSTLYTDLATAVNAATAGATIRVSAGNYAQSATLNLDENNLTLKGAGQGSTVITSQASSYGILWTGNNITLRDLSYNGPSANAGSSYGFKIQPGSSTASAPVTGVTLTNVTVKGSGRAEIDLHYVDGALIRNVTANGNNTQGAGVALTASRNVTLEDVTTSGNLWGSVAVYTKPGSNTFTGDPDTSSDIVIDNLTFDEDIVLYGEGSDSSTTATTKRGLIPALTAPQFTHTVRNATYRSNGAFFTHYRPSLADARSFAASLHTIDAGAGAGAGAGKSVVTELATGHFLVSSGLSIQAAVDTAGTGATVGIGAGLYAETVKIGKPLTLSGAGTAQVTLAPGSGNGIEILGNTNAVIDGVHISGLGIDAPGIGIIALSNTVPANQYDSANITIDDVAISVEAGNTAGIGLFDVDGATLTDVTITGHTATAVGALEMVGVRNLDINGLVVSGNSRSVKLFEVDGYAANGAVTIRQSQLASLEVIGTSANVDAKQNWWGSAAGPEPDARIIGSAQFKPWAVSSALTALSTDAAALNLSAQPGTAQVGAVITPAPSVRVLDHEGNPVAGASVTVQVSTGATLGGTTTVSSNASGLATFSNLTVSTAGSFTLTFSVTGLVSASSNSFAISAPPPEPEPEPQVVTPPPPPVAEPLPEALQEIISNIVIPPPDGGTGLTDTVIAAVGEAASATTELASLAVARIDSLDTSTAIDTLAAIGTVVNITGSAATSNAASGASGQGSAQIIASGTTALDSFSSLLTAIDTKASNAAAPAALSEVQKTVVQQATVQAAASAVQILAVATEPEEKRAVLETLGRIISSNVNLGVALTATQSATLLDAADKAAPPAADAETLLQNSVPLKPENKELISRELLTTALANTGISDEEVGEFLAELAASINPANVQVGDIDGAQALVTGFNEGLADSGGSVDFDPDTGTTFFTIGLPTTNPAPQPQALRRSFAQTIARKIPARVVSSNIVPSAYPDGITTRPDGSVVITNRRIASLVVPAAHDPIGFYADMRPLGTVAYDTDGNVTITKPGVLRFSATFDFKGGLPGTPGTSTVLAPSSGGNASDPAYVYTVTYRDGTTQVLQPFVDAAAFVESVRQRGLTIAINRNTGIVTVGGQHFRPNYLVESHTASSLAWWNARKDASGLAYRSVDANADGNPDYEVHSSAGVQVVYGLAE